MPKLKESLPKLCKEKASGTEGILKRLTHHRLADDLRRFLVAQPIHVRPITTGNRKGSANINAESVGFPRSLLPLLAGTIGLLLCYLIG